MTKRIPDLGVIGTLDGNLTPVEFTLTRNGAVWNLTGYTSPAIVVVDSLTKTAIVSPGTVTVTNAVSGIVRWIPNAAVIAVTGTYEARIYVTPAGGTPEPSGLFRFSIVEH